MFRKHPETGEEVSLEVVAKYPLDEWEKAGAPYMSQENWCELIMRICHQNMTDLEDLYRDAEWSQQYPDRDGKTAKKRPGRVKPVEQD